MNEERLSTEKKARIALGAGAAFAFLFALTWALPFAFNWTFFGGAAYSFFLYWYYQPRVSRFEQRGQYEYQAVSPAERFEQIFKRVIRISGFLAAGFFALFFFYVLFSADDQTTTQSVAEGESVEFGEEDPASEFNRLGYNFYQQQQFDSALYYFDKALERDSGNGASWYNKGMVYYAQQDANRALDAFTRAYELGVRDAFLSHVLGYLNDNSGNTSRAIDFYKEAIGMDSSRTDIYVRLAELEPERAARYKALEEKFKN
jgi:tetratricopeptide (TPR) repeat protein